jgi:hypothetical protein
MIIEIALGIVLGAILLAVLPYLLIAAAYVLVVGLCVGAVVFVFMAIPGASAALLYLMLVLCVVVIGGAIINGIRSKIIAFPDQQYALPQTVQPTLPRAPTRWETHCYNMGKSLRRKWRSRRYAGASGVNRDIEPPMK